MAKELKQTEIWFPSELLYDGLYLASEQRRQARAAEAARFDAYSCFSSSFPIGFALNPQCSPGESTVAEAACDEDEYIAGLTRRMAHSFLHDDDNKLFPGLLPYNTAVAASSKARVMAGSPQSTLSPWSADVRKRNNPVNCHALVPSPPISSLEFEQQQMSSKDDGWDLLCEDAGQVMRLRPNELDNHRSLYDRGLVSPLLKKLSPFPVVSATHEGAGTGNYTSHFHAHQEMHAAQIQHLKQQQLSAVSGRQNYVRDVGGGGVGVCGEGRCGRPIRFSSGDWPRLSKPHQQQITHGSEMSHIFLNSTGVKKESAGTGVFLPRTARNKTEPRKKPACSTVLVPARVVQALSLNLELGGLPRVPGGYVLDHDALVGRSNAVLANQKRNPQRQPLQSSPAVAVAGHEIRLPQEWTY